MPTSKMGRPRDAVSALSITFRLPSAAHRAVEQLAETVAAALPERTIRVGDVYNAAFYAYLARELGAETAKAAWPGGVEDTLPSESPKTRQVEQGGGRTVCVRIPEAAKRLFQQVLATKQQALGVAGSGLSLSGLYAAAVGALLLSGGVRIAGWNWIEGT